MNIKHTAAEYFQNKPIKSVYLFGSYARQDANENSDIDLLIDIDYSQKAVDLFDLYEWAEDLQKLFNHKVDLIPADGLSKFMSPIVNAEKVLIYAK